MHGPAGPTATHQNYNFVSTNSEQYVRRLRKQVNVRDTCQGFQSQSNMPGGSGGSENRLISEPHVKAYRVRVIYQAA